MADLDEMVSYARAAGEELSVKVERAAGVKCERCWKYTADVGSDARFPSICAGCAGYTRSAGI